MRPREFPAEDWTSGHTLFNRPQASMRPREFPAEDEQLARIAIRAAGLQ